jgi:hypothetical protein
VGRVNDLPAPPKTGHPFCETVKKAGRWNGLPIQLMSDQISSG